MYKTSDGGFKPDSVPVEKTTVYFTKDGETPHIDRVHVYYNVVKCTICGQEQYRDYITYNLFNYRK